MGKINNKSKMKLIYAALIAMAGAISMNRPSERVSGGRVSTDRDHTPTPTTTLEIRSSSALPTETENGTTMLTTTPGSAHSRPTHERLRSTRPELIDFTDRALLLSNIATNLI